MSYYVVYDRRFIRTTRGIIPMILIGDSSLRDARNAICRHWSCYNPELVELETKDILQWWREKTSAADPEAQLFKWKSGWISNRQIVGWFSKGCTSARTLEDYILANHRQRLYCKVVVFPSKKSSDSAFSHQYLSCSCTTTSELERWIDAARVKVSEEQNKDPDGTCMIAMEFFGTDPLQIWPASDTTVIARDRSRNHKSYVKEYVKGQSLTFTPDIEEAVVFDSVSDALEKLGEGWDIRFVHASKKRASGN